MCETCKSFQREFFRQAAFYLNLFQMDSKEIERFFVEPWHVVELYNRVEFQLILEAWREHAETYQVSKVSSRNDIHHLSREMVDISGL